MADDLLTTRQLAERFGMSVWTVRYHHRRGRLEGLYNELGHLRFTESSVQKFAEGLEFTRSKR